MAGDDLWVSGALGGARLALEVLRGNLSVPRRDFEACRMALEQPQPRVALGLALRGVASAAIDLSDGLLGDLGHVLAASGVGAEIDLPRLPCPPGVARLAPDWRLRCMLEGGDDYELLFTAPPRTGPAFVWRAAMRGWPCTAWAASCRAPVCVCGMRRDGRFRWPGSPPSITLPKAPREHRQAAWW